MPHHQIRGFLFHHFSELDHSMDVAALIDLVNNSKQDHKTP